MVSLDLLVILSWDSIRGLVHVCRGEGVFLLKKKMIVNFNLVGVFEKFHLNLTLRVAQTHLWEGNSLNSGDRMCPAANAQSLGEHASGRGALPCSPCRAGLDTPLPSHSG